MVLKNAERDRMVEFLHNRYAKAPGWKEHFTYWRKKYAWLIVVKASKFLKRLLDVLASLILLILLSPLFLLFALLIKLDGGPVFYVSDRVGKWGREFRFPKFRTMRLGAEKEKDGLREMSSYPDDVNFKIRKDPRVTAIGRFLRKSSLDELPQLWCVLIGEMSLVGPRPPLVEEVAKYTLAQRRRLDTVPGLTCIWQVSGRSELPFAQQVELDIQYIESQSLWLDFKLLLKTIPAILFGKGAY